MSDSLPERGALNRAKGPALGALWLSSIAFTPCLAVWTILSVIGVQIQKDLSLTEAQFGGRIVSVGVMLATALAAFLLTPLKDLQVWRFSLSDKLGARRVMYWMLFSSLACLFLLSFPATSYIVQGIRGPIGFTFALGLFTSLGGFLLPIAFGSLSDSLGVWTSCFILLSGLAGTTLLWMYLAVRQMEKLRNPALGDSGDLPELGAARHPVGASAPRAARILAVAPADKKIGPKPKGRYL